MKRLFLILAVVALCGVTSATNPVLVDSGGSGQFTTIQAAINSWCVGGTNAGETAPFVVKLKAGSGPYDEQITLDSSLVGQGNIVGDIVIESDTPGTLVVVKLRKSLSTATGDDDDGLLIKQNDHDVTFRDILFTRSLTDPVFTDELVRFDEPSANTNMNVISLFNCVLTLSDAAGNPLCTDKAGALVAPAAYGGATMIAGARLFQAYNDAGESYQAVVDNCVFYGGTSTNVTMRTLGTGAESISINNSLSSYAGYSCWEIGSTTNASLVVTVTGTDQKAGPLNCTAGINPSANGHCFTIINVAGMVANFSKVVASAAIPASTTSRGISGGASDLTLTDVIINGPYYGVVDTTNNAATWTRVTINTGNAAYYGAAAAPGSLTIRDSIISGAGTKFALNMPAGGINIDYSALPTSGPYAITAVGGGASVTQGANMVTDDPMYASTDGTIASFMDVTNSAYAGKGTAGANLSGGADYVTANVSEWRSY